MTLQKFFFVFAFLVVFVPAGFGQNQSEKTSPDDFKELTGDNLQERINNFVNTISQNNSRGLIILYAPKGSSILRYLFEGRVKGCFKMWKIDESNISYIFADGRDDIFMQFWEVPPNSSQPEFKEIPRDYKLADLSKPVMLDNIYKKVDYCPLSFDMKFYSSFLNANPNIDAKIVIYEETLKTFESEKLKYTQELTQTEKVSPQRITFVRGKYKGVPDAEFWLVPAKKK